MFYLIGSFVDKRREKGSLFKKKERNDRDWETIKIDPEEYVGKVVTWKCTFYCERAYDFLPYFGPFHVSIFHLNGDPSCPVVITGSPDIQISKSDSVLITGRVDYVTLNGEIRLTPIKMERLRTAESKKTTGLSHLG